MYPICIKSRSHVKWEHWGTNNIKHVLKFKKRHRLRIVVPNVTKPGSNNDTYTECLAIFVMIRRGCKSKIGRERIGENVCLPTYQSNLRFHCFATFARMKRENILTSHHFFPIKIFLRTLFTKLHKLMAFIDVTSGHIDLMKQALILA